MNPEPVVSVLMPVYNGEKFLDEAIQSILSQSFGDFELIAIDDGSTDSTRSILEGYAHQDGRVKVFAQENHGLVITLNRGLKLACGKYLARMDADDVSMLERLERQTAVMERNASVVLLGSACNLVHEDGSLIRVERPPLSNTIIRWQILFDNPFIHSAVMLRMAIVREHALEYCPDSVLAEDYDLWSRMLDFGLGQNLREALLVRRFHDEQISEIEGAPQISGNSAQKITQANILKLGFTLSEEQADTLRRWSHQFPRTLNASGQALCMTLLDILDRFCLQLGLENDQLHLVRGRVVLRMLMARSDEPGGLLWKYLLLRRLSLSDLAWVVKYARHWGRLSRKFL